MNLPARRSIDTAVLQLDPLARYRWRLFVPDGWGEERMRRRAREQLAASLRQVRGHRACAQRPTDAEPLHPIAALRFENRVLPFGLETIAGYRQAKRVGHEHD